jgi:hypothetical protein
MPERGENSTTADPEVRVVLLPMDSSELALPECLARVLLPIAVRRRLRLAESCAAPARNACSPS